MAMLSKDKVQSPSSSMATVTISCLQEGQFTLTGVSPNFTPGIFTLHGFNLRPVHIQIHESLSFSTDRYAIFLLPFSCYALPSLLSGALYFMLISMHDIYNMMASIKSNIKSSITSSIRFIA